MDWIPACLWDVSCKRRQRKIEYCYSRADENHPRRLQFFACQWNSFASNHDQRKFKDLSHKSCGYRERRRVFPDLQTCGATPKYYDPGKKTQLWIFLKSVEYDYRRSIAPAFFKNSFHLNHKLSQKRKKTYRIFHPIDRSPFEIKQICFGYEWKLQYKK